MSQGSSKKSSSSNLELKVKVLKCKTLHEYLKSLSPVVLDKLYSHPMPCLAVFRELSEIAKHYIMRILFVEQGVPQPIIASWISKTHAVEHKEATETLIELRIFKEASVRDVSVWTLNSSFKKNCLVALFGGGKSWFMSTQLEADLKPRDISFLDTYAMERWECVLYYMVGSHQHEGISTDAVKILFHAGLLIRNEDGSPNITKEGFQFLLMDTSTQVWYFMLQYLDTAESLGLDLSLCLMFLFQLRFSILGKDYSTDGLTDGLLTFLQHLREFGLVYQRKRKAGRFYPTRLALVVGSKECSSLENLKIGNKGYIIVETNYRVYAYTTSNLKIAIVGLFCTFLFRFPGLAVGIITRESIRNALRSGITAEQIVHFLKTHAHPKMTDTGLPSILPPTVIDQIYLWEKERNRFTFTEGALYYQFVSESDFDVVANYANDHGAVIWQNERKRMVVVRKSSHEEVKKFWKKYSKGNSS